MILAYFKFFINIYYDLNVTFNVFFEDINLIIPQSNGHDIKFIWNKQNYTLVADMDFWQQPYQVNSFINKISQQYANEVTSLLIKQAVLSLRSRRSHQYNLFRKPLLLAKPAWAS